MVGDTVLKDSVPERGAPGKEGVYAVVGNDVFPVGVTTPDTTVPLMPEIPEAP